MISLSEKLWSYWTLELKLTYSKDSLTLKLLPRLRLHPGTASPWTWPGEYCSLSLSLSLSHTHTHTHHTTHTTHHIHTLIQIRNYKLSHTTLLSLVYTLTHSISLFSFCFSCLRVVNDDVYCTLRSTDEAESKHSDKRLVQIFGQCICDVYKAFLRLRRGDGQWFLLLDLLIWRSLLMVFAYSNKVWGKMCLV